MPDPDRREVQATLDDKRLANDHQLVAFLGSY